MIRMDKEDVVLMHAMLIKTSGGSKGIRDERLLESALNAPFQTFDGKELYPTIINKAASLCYGLIKNHAFVDGNKRIGILVLIVFLEVNGIIIEPSNNQVIELGLGIASGKIEQKEIVEWIVRHIS